jgi:hypothetical protein
VDVKKYRFWMLGSVLPCLVGGCASPSLDGAEDFRAGDSCVPGGGAGLIGLSRVDIGGTPHIAGAYPSVFSNLLVEVVGTADIDGAARSGGSVEVSGTPTIAGGIVENAPQITVPDPRAAVAAARSNNDNDRMPCVPRGNDCDSPLVGFDLELNGQDELILPAGIYYFESISINGQASLGTDGDVTIYLDGRATFNGGSATDPGNDTLILVAASTDVITLNGGAEATMHIFAPFAEVKFSGTQGFSGTAIADILSIHGTADLNVSDELDGLWDLGCESEGESGETGSTTGGDDLPDLPDQPD